MSGPRATHRVLLFTCITLGLSAAVANGQTCPMQRLPGEGVAGVNGSVYAAVVWDPDGPGPAAEVLVVGGGFSVAGNTVANAIACWDPATSTWSALGAGMNGPVHALAVLDNKLYAGGAFTTAGGVNANRVACWDPATSSWSALGWGVPKTAPSPDPCVFALAVLNGKLYAGGSFARAGTVNAKNVACWDPATSTWSAMGAGLDGGAYPCVKALAVLDDKLYAGGSFLSPLCIACWDPATSTWSSLGSGTDGEVYALTVLENKLYVGGKFHAAGGVAGPRVACWDPATSTWSSLDAGVGGSSMATVYALTTLGGRVYVGGTEFYQAGGVPVYNIACWDPAASTWSHMGFGMSYGVRALAALNQRLYAGGDFHLASYGENEVAANRVACWDPAASTWSALGMGMGGGGIWPLSLQQALCYCPRKSGWQTVRGRLIHGSGRGAR